LLITDSLAEFGVWHQAILCQFTSEDKQQFVFIHFHFPVAPEFNIISTPGSAIFTA